VGVPVKIEVNVPAGIDDDQNLIQRGKGDAGLNGGPAGDLIIIVTVRPDAMFERNGYDVYVNVPITFAQASLGAKMTVPTVDGKVEYTVPEGTQSGVTFRLKSKGIPYVKGRGRGDQYVRVSVEVPKKLTKQQRDALAKFDNTLKDDNYDQRKSFNKGMRERYN
jgi:molecular chaperone DnaJ